MRHLVCKNEEPQTNEPVGIDHRGGGSNAIRNYRQVFQTEDANLGRLIGEKVMKGERFCSFEVFPVGEVCSDIYQRLFAEIEPCSPLFYSVTWHADTLMENHPSLRLAENLASNTLLHLAAKGLKRQNVRKILNRALSRGKTNIFALQGDSSMEGGDFPYAVDLVKFIREHYGSRFCICVAGYPETHPKSATKEIDLYFLKAKVDAGASFVITQLFFDSEVFIKFVKDCRQVGIAVPIIPGIFPMPNLKSLLKMAKICKVKIPESVLDDLRPMEDNDEAVAKYGVELTTNIIKHIFESGVSNGFHMFTLNRSSLAIEVCRRVGLYQFAAYEGQLVQ